MLIMASSNYSDGDSTTVQMSLLRFKYDVDLPEMTTIVKIGRYETFGIDRGPNSNTLAITRNPYVAAIRCTVIWDF